MQRTHPHNDHCLAASPTAALQRKAKGRFQFSFRTLTLCFAGFAVIFGLVGKASTTYLLEKRVANRIEALGGTVVMATVPPRGFDALLYRLGAKNLFRRIVNVRIADSSGGVLSAPPQMMDSLAESIGGLRHLVFLRIGHVPVTDKQLMSIAKCRSLTELQLVQYTPYLEQRRLTMRNRVDAELQLQLSGGNLTQEQNDMLKEVQGTVRGVTVAVSAVHGNHRRVTDKGILAFEDHPQLEELEILGCDVETPAYERVLKSLGKNEAEIEEVMEARFGFETEKAWLGVTRSQPTSSSVESAEIRVASTSVGADVSRLKYVLPDDPRYRVVLLPGATNELPNLLDCKQLRSLTIHTPDIQYWRPVSETLAKMDWLESLAIIGAVDDLGLLVDMKRLRELRLTDTTRLTRDDIVALKKLPRLKVAQLPSGVVTMKEFERLIEIETSRVRTN